MTDYHGRERHRTGSTWPGKVMGNDARVMASAAARSVPAFVGTRPDGESQLASDRIFYEDTPPAWAETTGKPGSASTSFRLPDRRPIEAMFPSRDRAVARSRTCIPTITPATLRLWADVGEPADQ